MSKLLKRLTEQLIVKGHQDAQGMAKKILIDRGHLNKDGSDTTEGRILGDMSPEERALQRHVKRYGGDPEDYIYDPNTNTCYKD